MSKKTNPEAQFFPHNPRKISNKAEAQLGATMAQFGDISSIVFNRTTKNLVGGNQRSKQIDLQTATIQVFKEFDKPDAQGTVLVGAVEHEGTLFFYREVEWDEQTEKEANIIANKAGGEFDFKVLEEYWDLDLLLKSGFKKSELKWMNKLQAFDTEEKPLPKMMAKPKTKIGDLYEFGDHRLLCGDATDPEQISLLVTQMVDAIITDPPYNVAYDGNRLKPGSEERTIENDDMPDQEFRIFMRDFYTNWTYQMEPGAAWYIFHADSNGHIFREELMNAGNYLAQVLVWVKDQKVMGRSDYHWQHEPCIYGIKPDPVAMKRIMDIIQAELGYTFQIYDSYHQNVLYGWRSGGAHRWESDRSQSTVLNYNRPRINDLHPTMKPIGMLEYLINNSTIERQTVADPFAGSGSTMIAAENTNRKSILMELDPANCDTIIRRYANQRQEKEQTLQVSRNGKDISKQKWLIDGKKTTSDA